MPSSPRRSCHRYQGKGYRGLTGRTRKSEAGFFLLCITTGFFVKQPKLGGTTDYAFVPTGTERVFCLKELDGEKDESRNPSF